MKHLVKLMAIAIISVIAFQSCGGNDEPGFVPKKEEYKPYNSKDSALFCDIMKAAYGSGLQDVCNLESMRLDSIETWPNSIVIWEWFEDIREKRIVELSLLDYRMNGLSDGGIVSPKIWEIDSLRYIQVYGKLFYGGFPARGGKCEGMKHIDISNTNISSIYLDLFTLKNLSSLYITDNPRLRDLPEGFEYLPEDTKEVKTLYKLSYNGFSGKVPSNYNLRIWYSGNNFSSIDWQSWRYINFGKVIRQAPENGTMGPLLRENRLVGEVPAEIIADTLALIYTYRLTWFQQEGYGLTGFPTEEEIEKRKKEYSENHPEYKEYLEYW